MGLELLSPAGDFERLKMAVLYGADAVYLAGTAFGMRSFAGNFTPEELPRAVKLAHDSGVKVHVTVNTMPRNEEIAQLPQYLEQLGNFVVSRHGVHCDVNLNAAVMGQLHRFRQFLRGEVTGKRPHSEGSACQVYGVCAV